MTREEAIKILEEYPCSTGEVDGDTCAVVFDAGLDETEAALDMAIAALREQEERSKGCEWCESLDKKNRDFKNGDILARGVVEHTFWGDGRWYMQEPKFCPMCGRRLEEV